MATVDVVIPAYNAARSIADAIRSVQAQSFDDIRMLVVDDGSTDDTRRVIEGFVDGTRVLCFTQENRGVSAARNRGILEASAPFISFLDADDLWLPDMLSSCLSLMAVTGCALASVDNYLVQIDEDGPDSLSQVQSYEWIERPPNELFLKFLEVGAVGGPHKAVFRKEVFNRVGLFDPSLRFYEDLDLWIRIARAQLSWGHVPRPLVVHHVGSPTALSSNAPRSLACRVRVVSRYASEAVQMEPEFRKVLGALFWNFGRTYALEYHLYREAASCFLLSLRHHPNPLPVMRSAIGFLRSRRESNQRPVVKDR